MSVEVSLRHRQGAFRLDVDFRAEDGIVALFGKSGAGKSSVVNAVAGLLAPQEGRVAVNGEVLLDTSRGISVPVHRRRIGYVFQEGRLFPHLTVRRNLGYGAWVTRRKPDAAATDRVVELLGLRPLLDRRPGLLSGGEKQRVAIGRALLSEPRLLLMDEPLAALDEARKADILPYLERVRGEMRLPILYVSHAVAEVARLADTIVILEAGRVIRTGPAGEVLSDPETVPAFGVRDAGAILAARVVAHHPPDRLSELRVGAGTLFVPEVDAAPGAELRIRIDASDVVIATTHPENLSALNILPATVTTIREGDGPGAAVGLDAGGDQILARITRRSVKMLGLAPGTRCFAVLKSLQIARADIGR